ncbi:MAG TPA: response regulator transcription factor [Pyrinomonadaceae bacterium]|jgi:two-component system, NarL family, nitrate/nitrite response regulator NarL
MKNPRAGQLRIMIVDDHLMVRAGLRMLLEDAGMEVVAMAGNRGEALDLAAREEPDMILLDLDLGREDGLSFLPELREAAKNARVLILTGRKDPEAHRRAVQLGAMGVVLKDQAAEILIKAIEKVYAGEVWLDRATMGNLLNEMTRKRSDNGDPDEARINSLTGREHQVIALIAEGLKNKQIAGRLFISETTVTHHLSSIFSKLEVSDRLELVIYAFGHNLARLPR